ncbi:MAG: hypothetical protein ACP5DX_18665 [Paracoccaceae bacterium]
MSPARLIRRLALWAGLLLVAGGVSAAPVTLAPAEMRAAASHALAVHDDQLALSLAEALLARDPQDGFALIIKSRAARNLGDNATAIGAARAAWRQARSESDRYAAALVMAQALSSNGQRTMAQLWLRRAAQHAPDDRAEAMIARDFRYVRSRNPWSTHLRFGVTPSSNINNGSKSDTMVIGGLPFQLSGGAQALSGLEISYGASTRYSHDLSEDLTLHLGGAVEGKAYRLSDAARRKAPALSASDLAYQAVQLSFGATIRGTRPANPLDAALTLGKNYYGGAHLADFAEVKLVKTVGVNRRNQLRFTLAAEEQWRKDRADRSSTALIGQVDWRTKVGETGLLQLSLGLRDTDSDSGTVAHSAQLAALDYRLTKPVFGAYLGLSVAYESRDYDQSLFGAQPRRDDKLMLGATVFLPDYDYYGFAPEIGLSLVTNRSNEALYETEDLGLTLGFRSAF